jgi:hypothetical protein
MEGLLMYEKAHGLVGKAYKPILILIGCLALIAITYAFLGWAWAGILAVALVAVALILAAIEPNPPGA